MTPDDWRFALEREVTARGGTVHWARDANEANAIVTRLVQATGETEVVKVKSMATQEIGLNEALEAAGVKVGKTPSETAALAREILESLSVK